MRSRPEELGLAPVGSRSPRETLPSTGGSNVLSWGLIYRVKDVWHLGIVYLMYGFSYIIYMHFFSTYLEKEMGLSSAQAGILWAWAGGLSIFCGIVWGGISDLIGRRYGAALAYITLAFSYFIFAFYKSMVGFSISAVVFGITAWSIPTIMAATAGDYVGPRLAPAGLGFITVFFGIGQAFGPYVGGLLADMTDSFTFSFALASGVSVIGALGSVTLRRPPEKA
jgi:MFS family permease